MATVMSTTMEGAQLHPVDISDDQDHSVINEEIEKQYSIWKKNTPFLYDYVFTNSLLWPSITVQFLPDLEKALPKNSFTTDNSLSEKNQSSGYDVELQRLLVGSFTLGIGIDSISIFQLPYYKNLNKQLDANKLDYNPDKEEFELTKVPKKSLNQLQKINHRGDVNKLRYMPQNPDVIASANNLGDLVIYDRTKHSTLMNSINTDINKPNLRLSNQNTSSAIVDIFAIDWNKQKEGVIVSGNMNGEINVYDIKNDFKSKENINLNASKTYNSGIGINDIEWIPNHDSILCAADDNGSMKLYDTRLAPDLLIVLQHKPSLHGINSLSINSANNYCLATANDIGNTSIWDLRNLGSEKCESTFSFQSHSDSITQLKWHPKFRSILGSSSSDKLVKIFDMNNMNTNDDELLFSHNGHMLGVNDFDWSLHDDWMLASVSDDNSFHIWKPAHGIIENYL